MPIIGIAGGGLSHRRGQVLDNLLRVCQKLVADHPIDVAIVATSLSSYAALQHQRRLSRSEFFGDLDLAVASRLGEAARDGSLALFIGAGTSVPAGAPSWRSLIEELADIAKIDDSMRKSFASLDPLDQAELLSQRLTPDVLRSEIAQRVGNHQPAIAHLLLAALRCREAVTTNYDDLYERAVAGSGDRAAVVLPDEVPRAGSRWLLKMHGDLNRQESIVLTRGQFVRFPASAGPSGAVLQALLLTRHLLVVGTSMTDDNVLRLIHEVAAYREAHTPQTADEDKGFNLGTILDVGDEPARRELHSRNFDVVHLPGAGLSERARNLEVLLDAVAMFSSSDHSWLLDRRFAFLLSSRDQALATKVVSLGQQLAEASEPGNAWAALTRELSRFGADTGKRRTR